MLRRVFLMLAAIVATTTFAAAFADVTLVLNNGERHSGSLVYHHDSNIAVVESGQEKSFPQSDVAVIEYVSGDPASDELSKLPTADRSVELQRNAVVLKTGEVIPGKVYDWQGDQVIFDTSSGRRTFNASDIARLYLDPAGARSAFNYTGSSTTASTAAAAATTGGKTIQVAANKPWTDTGIDVKKGDKVSFTTTGQVTVSPDKTAGPDGAGTTSSNAKYPVPTSGIGSLVGRVGIRGSAFPIGSNSNAITMPSNGRLLLGVNDDVFTDNSGDFSVQVNK